MTDCGIPISALLTSASIHDSLAAMPLVMVTAERVTNCYDLMGAAYCSSVLREHGRSAGFCVNREKPHPRMKRSLLKALRLSILQEAQL